MNLSAFRNPLVIAAIVGAGILSAGIVYIGGDCSQARAQAQRQAMEQAAFEVLMGRGRSQGAEPKAEIKRIDPKKFEKEPFTLFKNGRAENDNE